LAVSVMLSHFKLTEPSCNLELENLFSWDTSQALKGLFFMI
jgi:hypothetical protein